MIVGSGAWDDELHDLTIVTRCRLGYSISYPLISFPQEPQTTKHQALLSTNHHARHYSL